jgi:branched-chain amino acid transport system substrate-binding protein
MVVLILSTLALASIKIGLFVPLTGIGADDGLSALHGAQLAVDYLNSHGGVLGQKIELVYYDDQTDPKQAVSLAYKLVQKDGVVAVISGSYSGPTRAAASIYQRLRTTMISAYAVHPDITKAGDFIFRVGTLATVQGRAGAHLAVEKLGAKKIAVLIMDNDFGVSLANAFMDEAKKLGAEIVYQAKFAVGEKDFRTILNEVKKLDPDVIYATGYYFNASKIVTQAKELGIYQTIIGQEGYDSPLFIQLSKNHAANGTVITTDLDRDSDRKIVQWFISEYEKKFGRDADMVAASTFDAVMILAKAIQLAGKANRESIKKALPLVGGEDFVTGFKRFTRSREAVREVVCQVILGDSFHYFWKIDDPNIVTPTE